jgi:hypothetical protein
LTMTAIIPTGMAQLTQCESAGAGWFAMRLGTRA